MKYNIRDYNPLARVLFTSGKNPKELFAHYCAKGARSAFLHTFSRVYLKGTPETVASEGTINLTNTIVEEAHAQLLKIVVDFYEFQGRVPLKLNAKQQALLSLAKEMQAETKIPDFNEVGEINTRIYTKTGKKHLPKGIAIPTKDNPTA